MLAKSEQNGCYTLQADFILRLSFLIFFNTPITCLPDGVERTFKNIPDPLRTMIYQNRQWTISSLNYLFLNFKIFFWKNRIASSRHNYHSPFLYLMIIIYINKRKTSTIDNYLKSISLSHKFNGKSQVNKIVNEISCQSSISSLRNVSGIVWIQRNNSFTIFFFQVKNI